MGVAIVRILIGGFGVLLVLLSLGIAGLTGSQGGLFSALPTFITGCVLIAGVLLERGRYRSLHAESHGHDAGLGGGETSLPDPRFRPTEERFLDPSTRVPMRVWIDPATGERRYVPER